MNKLLIPVSILLMLVSTWSLAADDSVHTTANSVAVFTRSDCTSFLCDCAKRKNPDLWSEDRKKLVIQTFHKYVDGLPEWADMFGIPDQIGWPYLLRVQYRKARDSADSGWTNPLDTAMEARAALVDFADETSVQTVEKHMPIRRPANRIPFYPDRK